MNCNGLPPLNTVRVRNQKKKRVISLCHHIRHPSSFSVKPTHPATDVMSAVSKVRRDFFFGKC